MNTESEGWFKFEGVKSDGSRRLLADWFPNLITDQGLNYMGAASSGAWMAWCQVGGGSAAPTVSDTALTSRIAGTSTLTDSIAGAQSSAPYYGWRRNTYRFAEGAAAGNISEVGVGWASTGGLYSHALILDGSGNPTTISVLPDEFLDVTYELRTYPGTVDTAGSIVLDGETYNWLGRCSSATAAGLWAKIGTANQLEQCTAFDGPIGSIIGNPSGNSGAMTCTANAYANNSLQRDHTVSASLSEANFAGGIASIFLTSFGAANGAYQIEFTPPIPKTAAKVLGLTISHSWARRP